MAVVLKFKFFVSIFVLSCLIGESQMQDEEIQCDHPCLSDRTCLVKKSGDSCFYLFHKQLTDWQENLEFCREQKLLMAKPTMDVLSEGLDISDLLGHLDYYKSEVGVWLGGRSKNLDGWQFIKGTGGQEYIKDLAIEDQGSNITKCGYVQSGNLQFGVQDCSRMKYVICRYAKCTNSICLGLLPAEENWFRAKSHCSRGMGDLFYLQENEDWLLNELNKTLTQTLQAGTKVHIGLVHRFWLWSDGSQIQHFNWQYNQPKGTEEGCIMMGGIDSRWYHENCTATKLAFCQNDKNRDPRENTPPDKKGEKYIRIIFSVLGAVLGVSILVNVICLIGCLCQHCHKQKHSRNNDFTDMEASVSGFSLQEKKRAKGLVNEGYLTPAKSPSKAAFKPKKAKKNENVYETQETYETLNI